MDDVHGTSLSCFELVLKRLDGNRRDILDDASRDDLNRDCADCFDFRNGVDVELCRIFAREKMRDVLAGRELDLDCEMA